VTFWETVLRHWRPVPMSIFAGYYSECRPLEIPADENEYTPVSDESYSSLLDRVVYLRITELRVSDIKLVPLLETLVCYHIVLAARA
jgi:hypothetical protein